ncbi:unnamed protein product, partial [Protopolystoma xenopodis]
LSPHDVDTEATEINDPLCFRTGPLGIIQSTVKQSLFSLARLLVEPLMNAFMARLEALVADIHLESFDLPALPSLNNNRRVKGICKLVPLEAMEACLADVVVDLCEYVFGAQPCDPDESLMSFRPSCDGSLFLLLGGTSRSSLSPILSNSHK